MRIVQISDSHIYADPGKCLGGIDTRSSFATVLEAAMAGEDEGESTHKFLGVPDNETSGKGPVGLINGVTLQVDTVSKVRSAPLRDYLAAKRAANIVAEEEHDGYVYWAVEEKRDIPFDNATAWVTVLERYKSKRK